MPFETLRRTLLEGGIAPRHVRRYLTELSEHLDDLARQQREAGYDADDAASRARARLGSEAELASAMLEQKHLRSITARAPWAVFLLLPPVAGIVAAFVLIAPLALIANLLHMTSPHGILAPLWFQQLASAVTMLGNLALGPVLALGFTFLALRQRIASPWPLFAVLMIALLDLQLAAHFPGPNHRGGTLTVGATTWVFHFRSWLETWPLSAARLLLTSLPAVWLLRNKPGMVPRAV